MEFVPLRPSPFSYQFLSYASLRQYSASEVAELWAPKDKRSEAKKVKCQIQTDVLVIRPQTNTSILIYRLVCFNTLDLIKGLRSFVLMNAKVMRA